VDDDTWTHHLDQGDYSRWVRTCIKDDVLANEIAAIGRNLGAPPAETRRQVREAIERRYTLPASASRAAPDQQVREAGRP
jgi:hypothetical protein